MTDKQETNSHTIDLAEFSSDKAGTAILEIRNPKTGDVLRHADGRAMTITLLSAQSPEFVAVQRQQAERQRQQFMRTRQWPQITEREQVEMLVAVTVTWDLRFHDDKRSQPKPENYRACYLEIPAVREQVDQFVGNVSNFFQGASKN